MPTLSNLLVVVPGIGGSVLETAAGETVWGPGLSTLSGSLIRHVERLDISEPLRPVGVLPTVGFLPWMKVPGYDALETRLRSAFHLGDPDVDVSRNGVTANLSARLVFFPYDFRLPVDTAADRLDWDIERRLAALGRNARVIVVGHSMGGLVAKWWWARGGYKVCKRLITVGTPHRGAPKALDWLVNGVRIGSGVIGTATNTLMGPSTAMLRGWGSVYDMLPRYRAINHGARYLYPYELSVDVPDFLDRARSAYQRHLNLEQLCAPLAELPPPDQPDLFTVYSAGHPTLARAAMADGVLTVTKGDAEWLPNQGWLGDGTVPTISAIPIEHSEGEGVDRFRDFAPESHVALGSSPTLVEHLVSLSADSLATVRRGQAHSTWVGFDIDDVVATGEKTRIAVRINGELGVTDRPMLSFAVAGETQFGKPVPMRRETMRDWSIVITPTRGGIYNIRATVGEEGALARAVGFDTFGACLP